jgi:hypothetical protein
VRTAILICLVALLATPARAHDPYELTSVAYVRSNQIELFIEMEFPAAMTLAGQKPVRNVAVLSQFETALPHLRELAGGFYQLSAGNNALYPVSTNVELGVEDHIQFKITYPPTNYRPLQFAARGLGAESGENPYGTSLTVLDMVNQKVLGQVTLFAGQPNAEFPPTLETNAARVTSTESKTPSVVTNANSAPPVTNTNLLANQIPIEPKAKTNRAVLLIVLGAGLILGIALLRWRK